jgi:hypothetical protein
VSDHEQPDLHALRQLESLVRHLGEELATFRRRAMQAETRLRGFESPKPGSDLFTEQRVAQLERENADLQARLAFATERARTVLQQVRFLRQQAARPVSGAVTAGGDR